jgi:hypothetical protein
MTTLLLLLVVSGWLQFPKFTLLKGDKMDLLKQRYGQTASDSKYQEQSLAGQSIHNLCLATKLSEHAA